MVKDGIKHKMAISRAASIAKQSQSDGESLFLSVHNGIMVGGAVKTELNCEIK